ncbi:MAG: phytoene/squalene synthase family protein [Bryobacterales bacterium]|jgi:phytoene synthase|nr:phytoene/squalene synthase family protein [Bryobacterales bacterium]
MQHGSGTSHSLAQSYAHCETVARTRAKNFYYAFLLLPRAKRASMCAVYAFMRYCDDLSDDLNDGSGAAALAIQQWEQHLRQALDGESAPHPVWPAFVDTVQRYAIPHAYFLDMIQGVRSDLEPRRIQRFEELYEYCYRVASVVGLTVIHILGFQGQRALELAEKCGIAFQLTNILRDVREDAENGRVYLPEEDLLRFGVIAQDLCATQPNDRFRALMRFQSARAWRYYRESFGLVNLTARSGRACLSALIGIYSNLLRAIELANFDVLSRRIRLSAVHKIWILMKSLLGLQRLPAPLRVHA